MNAEINKNASTAKDIIILRPTARNRRDIHREEEDIEELLQEEDEVVDAVSLH